MSLEVLAKHLEKEEEVLTRRMLNKEIFRAEFLLRRGDIAVILSSGYIKPGNAVAWVEEDVVIPFGWVVDVRRRGSDYLLAVKEIERWEGEEIVEAENVLSILLRKDAVSRGGEILDFEYWSERDGESPEWLDKWQKKCFVAATTLERGEIVLVIGPPGTGKTTFIAEAARKLGETERVWVTSNTNIAVDNVLEKLDSAVRVGHPSKITEAVKKHSVEYKVLSKIRASGIEDYASEISRAYKEIARIISERMRRGNVVVGSTILKGMMSPLRNFEFDTVFIDEASNTCISTALLALEKAGKAVVVGDPFQLPPVYESYIPNPAQFSAFNYLYNKYGSALWLRRHYRCNSEIIGFSAKYVYRYLEIDERCKDIRMDDCLTSIKEVGDGCKPVLFIDCMGEERKIGRSKINEEEAEQVCLICDELSGCVDEKEIGVITPYVKQKELISSLLSDFGLKIEVSTVHSYQGREKDVIIYSITTTTNPYFASEKRIFNVAITRAKKKFIAVGNSKAIEGRNFLLSKYLDYVKSRGGYVRLY